MGKRDDGLALLRIPEPLPRLLPRLRIYGLQCLQARYLTACYRHRLLPRLRICGLQYLQARCLMVLYRHTT